ncbi:MAG: L-threonylcarbamoyladenylate synthase [Wenzhouxiangellaceae bacterium]
MTSLFHSTTEVLACLSQGGVIAYPTEGVFGLGCEATDAEACERIVALKQRSLSQGMIVLVSEWSQVATWIKPLTAAQQQRLDSADDDFITWLMPASESAPVWLTGGQQTLAVRRPTWPPLLQLCHDYGRPLVSTSANPHGLPAVTTVGEVLAYFNDDIDACWDHPCGGYGRPSSIISLLSGEQLR